MAFVIRFSHGCLQIGFMSFFNKIFATWKTTSTHGNQMFTPGNSRVFSCFLIGLVTNANRHKNLLVRAAAVWGGSGACLKQSQLYSYPGFFVSGTAGNWLPGRGGEKDKTSLLISSSALTSMSAASLVKKRLNSVPCYVLSSWAILVSLPSIFDHMLDQNGKRTVKFNAPAGRHQNAEVSANYEKFKSTVCMNASAEDGHWVACTGRDAM